MAVGKATTGYNEGTGRWCLLPTSRGNIREGKRGLVQNNELDFAHRKLKVPSGHSG